MISVRSRLTMNLFRFKIWLRNKLSPPRRGEMKEFAEKVSAAMRDL